MKLKQVLLSFAALVILLVLFIKLVPPVKSLAREVVPVPLLHLIGEEPKGLLEKGLDDLKSLIK